MLLTPPTFPKVTVAKRRWSAYDPGAGCSVEEAHLTITLPDGRDTHWRSLCVEGAASSTLTTALAALVASLPLPLRERVTTPQGYPAFLESLLAPADTSAECPISAKESRKE